MDIQTASRRVLLGESIASLIAVYRQELLDSVGLSEEEAAPTTFLKEAHLFAGKVCRNLAEHHASHGYVGTALADWARRAHDYDVFDALLSTYRSFDGRAALVRRGKALFPGPLTTHWEDEA